MEDAGIDKKSKTSKKNTSEKINSALNKVKNIKVKSATKDTYYKARNSVKKAVKNVQNFVVGSEGKVMTQRTQERIKKAKALRSTPGRR